MTKPIEQMTRDELRAEAKKLNIAGRGKMNADELRTAVQAELDLRQAEAEAAAALLAQSERTLPARLRPQRPLTPALPMSEAQRQAVYLRQNQGGALTARQRRQLRRKARANYGRATK